MMSKSRVGRSYVLAVPLLAVAFNSAVAQAIVDDQVEIQKTNIESAKATFQVAQPKRELAESALKEYEQGLFVQEKATLEAELKIARDELKMAQEHVPEANDRAAQIKQASKGSTYELVSEFHFSDQVVLAELGARKAVFTVQQLESKLKVLLEYSKPQRIVGLQAEFMKAKSEELSARANWDLEEAKLKRLQNPRNLPAKQPNDTTDTLEKLRDQQVNLLIVEETAEANFKNATLTREVAEIAVTEYVEGIFVQDQATLQGELKLAESQRDRAPDAAEIAKARLAMIKKASKGSVGDLSNEFAFADIVANAIRRVPTAELAVKKAEAKLKNLLDYTKPKRIKELEVEVEKARSDELAKKAEWQTLHSKSKRLAESIKALKAKKNP